MSQHNPVILFILLLAHQTASLIPPKFQWKTIDFAWDGAQKEAAISSGRFIAANNMPTGLARWKDKLFITIPRWKTGIPSSLNYVYLNGSQQAPLNPYPSWEEGCLTDDGTVMSNRTVVSTFRVYVDKCDRLWVVDNGVADMAAGVKQITEPALLIFDLKTDHLLTKHVFDESVLRESSVLTSVVADLVGHDCTNCDASCTMRGKTFAYITDMGSNAIIVYDLENNNAWRVENPYFHFDPHAGVYKVGGIDFYWSDGVSSAALGPPAEDGYSDLYLHPTSSTKQFKMSTRLLRNKDTPHADIFNGVEIVGDRGPKSQVTACDYDPKSNILFYTQVCKNGLGCWNIDKSFTKANTPVILSDCNLMEFPNDVKVDHEGNVWILSDRQSRFLYETMDYNDVNFRVLTAPADRLTQGTTCQGK
ncbi:dopaminechrome tautomerase-like [Anticarsia gemmatalis]|uniref:dopaminechrome tautomerase-like n=1 Tax=Anticarsia gemmatalis TaxID=129554 RepID=UPI003F758B8D